MSKTQAIWTGVKAPTEYEGMTFENSDVLHKYWQAEKQRLKDSEEYEGLFDQVLRQITIATGQIEGAYYLDRGVTDTLIRKGLEATAIPHDGNKTSDEIRMILMDQFDAMKVLGMRVVAGERDFNRAFLFDAHRVLLRSDAFHTATDPITKERYRKPFEPGVFKDFQNNPRRADGVVLEYCHPDHVATATDKLFDLYEEWKDKLHPIALAAWFHHELIKIHPFPDGNGRVTRLLTSVILIKADFMPFHVEVGEENAYYDALQAADAGNVAKFVGFVDRAQWPLLAGTAQIAMDEVQTVDRSKSSSNIAEASKRFGALVPKRAMQLPISAEIQNLSRALQDRVEQKILSSVQELVKYDSSVGYGSHRGAEVAKWLESFAKELNLDTRFNLSVQHKLTLNGIAAELKSGILRVSVREPTILAFLTQSPELDGREKSEVVFLEASRSAEAGVAVDKHLEKCAARLIDRLAELRNQQLQQ